MEADVRGRRRHRGDRRHEVLRRVGARRVDGDVRRTDPLEERERLRAVLVVEPRAVTELDEHLVAAELRARPLEIVERRLLEDDVRRELEEDPAELARAPQRLERLEEAPEDLAAQLARRPVDAAALVDRHRVAEILRNRLRLHRMPRHQSERLDVHREAGRRPLGPALDRGLRRQPVVRRVDLDRVEVLGVPREAFLRRELRRIEVLREGLVGPGARSDADRRGQAPDVSARPRLRALLRLELRRRGWRPRTRRRVAPDASARANRRRQRLSRTPAPRSRPRTDDRLEVRRASCRRPCRSSPTRPRCPSSWCRP